MLIPFTPLLLILQKLKRKDKLHLKTVMLLPKSSKKWSPLAHDVRTVLLSIQSLIEEPSNESLLNIAAAK
ncbi:hypothetical protein J437_LFUL000944 [Ladona fulva]|uniref:UBC core domain-containing protein n=1 Tax=Ladona fulva TaxID=123851 RepID=A0A8K0KBK4_LADFU|nr:hypothetical protein J437_LFUL000944 [Ladona fulva]